MTNDLIDRLARDLQPVPRRPIARLFALGIGAGAAIAAIAMLLWLGLRPDLAAAIGTPVFWIKFGYTLALTFLGLAAVQKLARPQGRTTWPWLAGAGLMLVLALAAWWQWSAAPPDAARLLVLGSSALVCPWYILALSLPVLACIMAALRRMAPARPALAGWAAGCLAGGTGAWVYSFHCTENGLAFLLIWYSLGILAVAAIGALLGRLLLRW